MEQYARTQAALHCNFKNQSPKPSGRGSRPSPGGVRAILSGGKACQRPSALPSGFEEATSRGCWNGVASRTRLSNQVSNGTHTAAMGKKLDARDMLTAGPRLSLLSGIPIGPLEFVPPEIAHAC